MDITQLNNYIDKHISEVDDLLYRLHRETHLKTLAPQMSSGHAQGRLLELISKMISPSLILEIGTYTGYSTLCLAKGLKENGKIVTIDVNEEVGQIAKKYFEESGLDNNIEQLFGNASSVIKSLDYNDYDLVFIDANKEAYLDYYELVIDKVKSGGIILADNILWYGKVWEDDKDPRTQRLIQFNKMISLDSRVENLILPLRDGVNIIRKK